MAPTTWGKFQKANYAAERPNHADKNATIRALAARWQLVKPPTKASRLAARRTAAARRSASPSPSPPPPDVAADGEDRGDQYLLASKYSRAKLVAGEHRPEGNESNWLGGGMLKEKDDKVVLWVRVDEDSNIAERRVVKTVQIERERWLDAVRWEGDVKDYQTRLPMDYYLQRRLCVAPDGGEFFNRVRACVIDNEAWTYKLVLDYCDHGDVGKVRDIYKKQDAGVPEPLAWSILEGLVKAVLVMEQGAVDSQVDDWREVIHRDFKPDNVFLTRTNNSDYPRVQLSDFEHSFQTTKDDPYNPKVFRMEEAGHEAYWAPELWNPEDRALILKGYPDKGLDLPTIPREDLSKDKLLAAANVWNIGTTMFDLMSGKNIDNVKFPGIDWELMRWNVNDMWWQGWSEIALKSYSNDLTQLVQNCLQDDPTLRPKPAELLQSIRADSTDAECNRKKKARGATAVDVAAWEDDDGFEYERQDDTYKLRMAYNDLLPDVMLEDPA